jgi:hypothetical protein
MSAWCHELIRVKEARADSPEGTTGVRFGCSVARGGLVVGRVVGSGTQFGDFAHAMGVLLGVESTSTVFMDGSRNIQEKGGLP